MSKQPIIIVGAGIGGLTAAIALRRAGETVMLVEQAATFGEVGAGLTLGPAAMRALDALDLGHTVRACADFPQRQGLLDHATLEPIVEGLDGYQAADSSGRSWFHQMHRADFHQLLLDALEQLGVEGCLLNATASSFDQDAHEARLHLADGRTVVGAMIVAAEGVRSRLRLALHPNARPAFTGQMAFRTLIPLDRVADRMGDYPSASIMGPDATFTRYQLRRGTLLNCVGIVRTDAWAGEGWSSPATVAEFLSHYEGWHPDVRAMIAAAPPETLIKWGLFDHAPLPSWSRGRMVLLGDAAHPILPFLGQGATMAIEDAVVLSRALGETEDIPSAIALYEDNRRPRTAQALERARRQGQLYQQSSAEAYRESTRPSADGAFFAYDAATTPLKDCSSEGGGVVV